MEKGANTSCGFSVSDKKSSSNSDFSSTMKLQVSTEAFPSKICMKMGIHHQGNNLARPSAGDDDDGGGGGGGTTVGGGVGPTNNSGGANEVVGNIYRDDVSTCRGGGENFAKSTNLQPFDIFPSSYSTIPYKSPAGGMATTVGFPFTSAQWKELERQAMIYKYMISSVPVPPDLLFPLSRNLPAAAVDSSVSSIYNAKYSKNGDPEPGRCKRTDGKKWRCSRDVAPHQKYCERHLHRGRPRSRKPVEVKNNGENHKKTRLEQSSSLPTVQSNCTASQQFVAANEPLLLFNAKTDLRICTPYYKGTDDRDLGLMMEGEMVARDGDEQPWQHLMEANMGLANQGFSDYSSSAPIFHQDYVEQQPMNVFSYPNFPAPEIEAPTGFIDAWSIDNLNNRNNGNVESSISLNEGDLSPSLNLSMAMAAGNVLDEEKRNIQMGVVLQIAMITRIRIQYG
ncbi:hypothetical protein Pfo_027920 [Paulownia fortunei]|nr:hypothetical protein Pfo_027920 [Paulownia fortunei]